MKQRLCLHERSITYKSLTSCLPPLGWQKLQLTCICRLWQWDSGGEKKLHEQHASTSRGIMFVCMLLALRKNAVQCNNSLVKACCSHFQLYNCSVALIIDQTSLSVRQVTYLQATVLL